MKFSDKLYYLASGVLSLLGAETFSPPAAFPEGTANPAIASPAKSYISASSAGSIKPQTAPIEQLVHGPNNNLSSIVFEMPNRDSLEKKVFLAPVRMGALFGSLMNFNSDIKTEYVSEDGKPIKADYSNNGEENGIYKGTLKDPNNIEYQGKFVPKIINVKFDNFGKFKFSNLLIFLETGIKYFAFQLSYDYGGGKIKMKYNIYHKMPDGFYLTKLEEYKIGNGDWTNISEKESNINN